MGRGKQAGVKPMSPELQFLMNSVGQTYHFTHRADTRLVLGTPAQGPTASLHFWLHPRRHVLLRPFSDESTEAQRESASLEVTQSEVGLDLPPGPSLEEPPPQPAFLILKGERAQGCWKKGKGVGWGQSGLGGQMHGQLGLMEGKGRAAGEVRKGGRDGGRTVSRLPRAPLESAPVGTEERDRELGFPCHTPRMNAFCG